MTAAGRHLANGMVRSYAVDYFDGMEAARELERDHGLVLDSRQYAALGRARADWREASAPPEALDHEPVLSEAASRVLDALVAERAVQAKKMFQAYRKKQQHCRAHNHRHAANESCDWAEKETEKDPQPAPEHGTTITPDIAGVGSTQKDGEADPAHAARANEQGHDRKEKKDPIKEMIEFEPRDEEWT